MRGITLFCICALGIMSILSTAQSTELGLAFAWLFEEGSGKETVDIVSGLQGELKGTVDWTADGKIGRGIQFPGQGDSYVWIAHDDVLDAVPFTLTVWTKLEAASWQYIAWKDGETWPEKHLKRHIDIWVHEADYPVVMWHNEGGGAEERLDGKTIIADGEWHHVAISHDGDNMRLFIDGALDGEAPGNGDLVINGEDALWIGARPGNVAATGIMDEFGFFTQALTEAQVGAVMDEGLAGFAAVESAGKLAVLWGQAKLN